MTVPVQSVTFKRTELSLSDLVITNTPFGTSYHIPEDGITKPVFETRVAFAPESFYIKGKLAQAAVADAGGLGLIIYAHAATSSALATLETALAAALNQWKPQIIVTIDGVATTYTAVYPVTPSWGTVDSGMVRAHMSRTSITVVVNPP